MFHYKGKGERNECKNYRGVSFLSMLGKEGRKWRLPFLLYAGDLVLCSESEEDLRVMVGWFVEVCRMRVMVGWFVEICRMRVMVRQFIEVCRR